jgi:hypothetical protein
MLTRMTLAALVSTLAIAGCVTSSDESTEQAQSGSDNGSDDTGGTGCIEGNCGSDTTGSDTTPTCAQADSVGDVDATPLAKHDPSSRGERCLDCHDGAAHPELDTQPPTFDFGGRVVNPTTGTGRAKAIIRMPSSEGYVAVESNDMGYFWWPPAGSYGGQGGMTTEVTNRATFPAAVGVETSGTLRVMCAEAINGNCASCHDGTTTAAIF